MQKEYILMRISPLRAHVFSLFITLCNKFHEFHLDNHYMSTKCVHLSYTQHNCVKVQGVCPTRCLVIPSEVLQTKLYNKKASDRVCNVELYHLLCTYLSSLNKFLSLYFFLCGVKLKAVVLDVIPDLYGPFYVLVYDTNPVHFLSMCCKSIKWVQKTRQV